MRLDHATCHRGRRRIRVIAAVVQRRADARTPLRLPATPRVPHARGVRRAAKRERARLCGLPPRQERGGAAGRHEGGPDECA